MTLLLSLAAIGLLLGAAATDIAWRRIPNRLVAALALVGVARLVLVIAGAPALGSGLAAALVDFAAAAAVLAAGAGLFHLNLVGGGDVKLAAAGALWLGAGSVWLYLSATALAGGVLALFYLAAGAVLATSGGQFRPSLPYGVAIAAGGILVTAASL